MDRMGPPLLGLPWSRTLIFCGIKPVKISRTEFLFFCHEPVFGCSI
jgi:hypothetical protein